jgi:hypothetical protein
LLGLLISRLRLGIPLLPAVRGPRAGSVEIPGAVRLPEAGAVAVVAIILIHCSYPFKKGSEQS